MRLQDTIGQRFETTMLIKCYSISETAATAARLLQHLSKGVHAQHPTPRPRRLCQRLSEVSGAAAQVDYSGILQAMVNSGLK